MLWLRKHNLFHFRINPCQFFRQGTALLWQILIIMVFSWAPGLTWGSPNCGEKLGQSLSLYDLQSNLAAKDFDLFVLAPEKFLEDPSGRKFIQSVSSNQEVEEVFKILPEDLKPAALRMLALRKIRSGQVPSDLKDQIDKVEAEQNRLRNESLHFEGSLTNIQQRDLTYMLVLVGERRSKLERVFEKVREFLGLESRDLVPVVPVVKTKSSLGNEVRRVANEYNEKIKNGENTTKAYSELTSQLFELYLKRQFQILSEPWFHVGGENQNLVEFVNSHHYRDSEIKPTSKWMNVVTLPKEDVQNPLLKGMSRELWWNRDKGINPLGTVRISRNTFIDQNGQEQIASVEVLYKTEDGFYVPFLFERDLDGNLRANREVEDQKKMKSCFGCHLRLSGIFFGGIVMKGYKAVDYWHINAIDFTRRKFYGKFKAYRH